MRWSRRNPSHIFIFQLRALIFGAWNHGGGRPCSGATPGHSTHPLTELTPQFSLVDAFHATEHALHVLQRAVRHAQSLRVVLNSSTQTATERVAKKCTEQVRETRARHRARGGGTKREACSRTNRIHAADLHSKTKAWSEPCTYHKKVRASPQKRVSGIAV